MGGTALPTFAGSRIANATRSWQAAEDTAVTGWTIGGDFIIAMAIEAVSKDTPSMTLSCRWRNVTDGGSFAALSATGELTWNATTDLVNGNAVTSGEAGCTGAGTWQDGVEREGANAITGVTLAKGFWSEYQWAVDGANMVAGKTYEFELYDITSATSIGTALATIAVAAAAETVTLTKATWASLSSKALKVNESVKVFSASFSLAPAQVYAYMAETLAIAAAAWASLVGRTLNVLVGFTETIVAAVFSLTGKPIYPKADAVETVVASSFTFQGRTVAISASEIETIIASTFNLLGRTFVVTAGSGLNISNIVSAVVQNALVSTVVDIAPKDENGGWEDD